MASLAAVSHALVAPVAAGKTVSRQQAAAPARKNALKAKASTFAGASVKMVSGKSQRLTAQRFAVTPKAGEWEDAAAELDTKSPLEIMDHALKTFGNGIAIAFSGAEDVALIHYAHLTGRPFRVFSLDTGRLNPETYRLFDAVEKRYNIKIEYTFPDGQECMDLVREKGMFSFYEDGHQECCRVRKVRPLRRQLATLDAWITGQRKDQSPGTRTAVPVVQVDPAFEGVKGGAGSLIKYNPLSNILGTDVWAFLRLMDVPVNDLHNQGYVSIGCEPCTRPVLPGQQEREGRWWWEDAAAKECGLHKGNIEGSESEEETTAEVADLYAAPAATKSDMEALIKGDRDADTMVVVYAPWCQFCQGFEETYNELVGEGGSVKMLKFQGDGDMKPFVQSELEMQTFPAIYMFPKHSESFIKYPSDRRDMEFVKAFVSATAEA